MVATARFRFGRGRRIVILAAALVVLGVVLGIAAAAFAGRGPRQALLDLTLEQLETQVRENPQDPQARLAVAIAYAARGYHQSAAEQFNEVLKVQPDNQTALMGLGRVHFVQKKWDAALVPLARVAELNQNNPNRYSIEQLQAVYYEMGVIYSEKQDYDQAAANFDEALRINRVDADTWYALGLVHGKRGDLQAALEAYFTALRFAPDFVEVYRAIGETYTRLGDEGGRLFASGSIKLSERSYAEAEKQLRAAIQLSPRLAEAHQALGLALEAQGNREGALAAYRAAVELDPSLMVADLATRRLETP